MSTRRKSRYLLEKKAEQGFRGYPVATIAYYGPDDKRATKVVVSIVEANDDVAEVEKWVLDEGDIRFHPPINLQLVRYVDQRGVNTVVMMDQIVGCPHEAGVDYPEGEDCPHCPFWEDKDRWASNTE